MQLLSDVRGTSIGGVIAGRRYRHALSRDWTAPGQPPRRVLWIGLNPATADATRDDRTTRREAQLSRRLGFSCYLKGNILDLMETYPARLPPAVQVLRSARNLSALAQMAQMAAWIVLAHGRLPPALRGLEAETLALLRGADRPVTCFQLNTDGTPAHTRRLLNANVRLPLVDLRARLTGSP